MLRPFSSYYRLNLSRRVRREESKGKGKGKVHHRTCYEGPEGEKWYTSTLSLTSTVDWSGWSAPLSKAVSPEKRPPLPSYRRLCVLQVRSGRVRKFSPPPTGIRSPDRPAWRDIQDDKFIRKSMNNVSRICHHSCCPLCRDQSVVHAATV